MVGQAFRFCHLPSECGGVTRGVGIMRLWGDQRSGLHSHGVMGPCRLEAFWGGMGITEVQICSHYGHGVTASWEFRGANIHQSQKIMGKSCKDHESRGHTFTGTRNQVGVTGIKGLKVMKGQGVHRSEL